MDGVTETKPPAQGQSLSPVEAEAVTKNVTEQVPMVGNEGQGVLTGSTPEMPEVKQNAIDAAKADAASTSEQARPSGTPRKGETDEDGRPYDPAIHETPMRLNKSGFIAKKRGGTAQKNLRNGVQPAQASKAILPGIAQEATPDANVETCAQVCAGMFLTTATVIGGDDLAPENDAEAARVKSIFHEYFKVKGAVDIPPGVALAFGLGMYVVTKWNKPKFVARRATIMEKVGRWWNDFKYRRLNRAVPAGVDNGTDKQ